MAKVFNFFEGILSSLLENPVFGGSSSISTQEKEVLLEGVLSQHRINLWELRELALTKGGLLKTEYRQDAWLRLVGIDFVEEEEKELEIQEGGGLSSPTSIVDADSLFTNDDDKKTCCSSVALDSSLELIKRDVGRSVVFHYHKFHQSQLPSNGSDLLAQVLNDTLETEADEELHYYQGLHDIGSVILHQVDWNPIVATQIMKKLAKSQLRDAMMSSFGNIHFLIRLFLLPLLEQVEPHVHDQLSQVELTTVCLPWIITWFTHDIYHPETAGRLVDAFLAGHALLPLYFSVALLSHPYLKNELLYNEDPDDVASMFCLVKKLPMRIAPDDYTYSTQRQRNIPVQELLEDALAILKQYPPRALLELIDPNQYSKEELLERVSKISALKAPLSFNMTSGHTFVQMAPPLSKQIFPNSKLASGVVILQGEVSSFLTKTKSWGSRRYLQKKKKRKLFPKVQKLIWKSLAFCQNKHHNKLE